MYSTTLFYIHPIEIYDLKNTNNGNFHHGQIPMAMYFLNVMCVSWKEKNYDDDDDDEVKVWQTLCVHYASMKEIKCVCVLCVAQKCKSLLHSNNTTNPSVVTWLCRTILLHLQFPIICLFYIYLKIIYIDTAFRSKAPNAPCVAMCYAPSMYSDTVDGRAQIK